MARGHPPPHCKNTQELREAVTEDDDDDDDDDDDIQRRGARFVNNDYQRTRSERTRMETSCTPKKRTKLYATLQDHQRPGSYPCHRSHSFQHNTIKIQT